MDHYKAAGRAAVKLLNLEEASSRLAVSPRSLADRRFRMRIGLAGRKVGRKLNFLESDIEKLVARGKERLPRIEGVR